MDTDGSDFYTWSIKYFVLARPGLIKVRAYRGDDEIRLGALRVRLRSGWEARQKEIAEGKEAAN
jgi:hypothetical protein